ncbi:hypothetical protein ISCGN_025870 [Ixodes scapularis]
MRACIFLRRECSFPIFLEDAEWGRASSNIHRLYRGRPALISDGRGSVHPWGWLAKSTSFCTPHWRDFCTFFRVQLYFECEDCIQMISFLS